MTTPTIATVVEGHGEVHALPVLLRGIASQLFGCHYIELPPPHRLPRGKMLAPGELHRAVRLQANRVSGAGGVLIVTDADDDCALELATSLRNLSGTDDVAVAVAVREYEAWLLASAESLRPHRAVRDDATFPGDPEAPRDAKGRLTELMTEKYQETLHQPALTSLLDPHLAAQRSRSFRHLVGVVARLIGKPPDGR